MSALPRIRALLRVELRELSRAKARSALICALIALPVAALVGGSTLVRICEPTPRERAARQLGGADLGFDGPAAVVDAALARLPPGVRTERVTHWPEWVEVPGLRLAATGSSVVAGGLAASMFRLVGGRWPDAAGEVALSPVLVQCARIELGQPITLASDRRRATVVGIIVDPEDLERAFVLSGGGVAGSSPARLDVGLVALPDPGQTAAAVAALRGDGLRVRSAAEIRASRGSLSQIWFLFGSLGFVEAALVVAAAFAIGLRRRQRQVGLLAAAGADPNAVVGSILGAAAVLAIVGSGVGVVVGVAVAALLHPHLDDWIGRMNGPFEIAVPQLIGAVGLGVVTAVVSAWVPARAAARLPVRVALGGRRPPVSPARPWLHAGGVMIAAALVLTATSALVEGPLAALCTLGGSVLGVLGFGACSPWLLGHLAQRASRLPLTWRLAVRDAGRFRSRNGPVVTAILAGMAVSVTTAAVLASIAALGDESVVVLRDDQLIVRGPAAAVASERIAADLPHVARAELCAACIDGEPVRARLAGTTEHDWVAVGGDDLLRALGAAAPAGADRSVELVSGRDWRVLASLPASDLTLRPGSPAFVLPSATAARLGLAAGAPPQHAAPPWLLRLSQPADAAALERAGAVAASWTGTSVSASLVRRRGPRLFFRVVLLLSVLTGLAVIGVATALTAVESLADRRVLLAVGATPRQRRACAAAGAAWLAVLGCALAVPAGLLPAFGATTTLAELRFVVPWAEIAAAVVGLPILAYAAAWCLTRPPGRVQRT